MNDNRRHENPGQLIAYTPAAMTEANVSVPFEEGIPYREVETPLAAYWYVLVKRRWTIAAVTVLLTAAAAVISFMTKPVYEATARLQIESETPTLQSSGGTRVDDDD